MYMNKIQPSLIMQASKKNNYKLKQYIHTYKKVHLERQIPLVIGNRKDIQSIKISQLKPHNFHHPYRSLAQASHRRKHRRKQDCTKPFQPVPKGSNPNDFQVKKFDQILFDLWTSTTIANMAFVQHAPGKPVYPAIIIAH